MNNDKTKPSVRFVGFNEDWEQRKLNEFVCYTSSPLTAKDVDNEGEYDLYDANSLIGKTDKFQINDDYISIIKDGAGVGRIRLLPKNTAFIGTMGAITANSSNLLFVFAMLTNKDLSKQFTGSTIPHIYFKDYGSEDYSCPTVAEQTAIGNFFAQLDSLITLQQHKCEKLKLVKKALLEKMFPHKDGSTPKLRFKGFNEEWCNGCLNDEISFFSGLTYSPDSIQEEGDGTLVLRSSNVKNGEISLLDNVFVDSKVVNVKNVEKGDIIVVVRNGSRNLIGKHAVIKDEMNNTVIGAFMTGVKADQYNYIQAMFDTNKFISEIDKNLGATINQITTGNFKLMEFMFPKDKKEKEKIGKLFSTMDSLIMQNNKKLEKLKNIKQALLEKMFV